MRQLIISSITVSLIGLVQYVASKRNHAVMAPHMCPRTTGALSITEPKTRAECQAAMTWARRLRWALNIDIECPKNIGRYHCTFSAEQTNLECLRRKLQRQVAGLLSESPLACQDGVFPINDRGMVISLQPCTATSVTGQETTSSIRPRGGLICLISHIRTY